MTENFSFKATEISISFSLLHTPSEKSLHFAHLSRITQQLFMRPFVGIIFFSFLTIFSAVIFTSSRRGSPIISVDLFCLRYSCFLTLITLRENSIKEVVQNVISIHVNQSNNRWNFHSNFCLLFCNIFNTNLQVGSTQTGEKSSDNDLHK